MGKYKRNSIRIIILMIMISLLSGKSCELSLVYATNTVDENTELNETIADETEVNETVALSLTEVKLAVGEAIKLKLNGATGNIKWSSSNKKIATVTKKGKIKAKKKGKVTITALWNGEKYECEVTVIYGLDVDGWMETSAPLISHAGGGLYETAPDGTQKVVTYSNSKEAIQQSLIHKYKLIEIDFMMTSDKKLACTHNWPNGRAMKLSAWKKYKINGKYRSMDLNAVLNVMKKNPDIYIVIDTKSDHSATQTKAEYSLIYKKAMKKGGIDIVNRIIPQIYNQKMYYDVKKIYKWPTIIYTLYMQDGVSDSSVVSFVKEKDDIEIVTIPKRRLKKRFLAQLHSVDKYTFSHTFDDLNALKKYRKRGVDGFYTNIIYPDAYVARYGTSK